MRSSTSSAVTAATLRRPFLASLSSAASCSAVTPLGVTAREAAAFLADFLPTAAFLADFLPTAAFLLAAFFLAVAFFLLATFFLAVAFFLLATFFLAALRRG